MAFKTIKLNDDGTISGAGMDAVKRMRYGRTYKPDSPEYGGDPTGVKDSRAAIQACVDDAAKNGGGMVELSGGIWRVGYPGIEMKGYTGVRGAGTGQTIIVIDQTTIPADAEETGVFHTGTYNKRVTDSGRFRIYLGSFTIVTSLQDGTLARSSSGALQHIDAKFFQTKMWGICFNTFLESGPADPDCVHTMHDIEIWDTAGGIALLGLDDQGCKITDIRIRRTWKQGYLIGKPFDHPEAWENNPADPSKPKRMTGAADNHFDRTECSGANQSLGYYAGFEVYGSQCTFDQPKSWYHKRSIAGDYSGTLPTGDVENIWNVSATKETAIPGAVNLKTDNFRFAKAGAGYAIYGRDNKFTDGGSQETAGHGWCLFGLDNTFKNCDGESPSYYDTVTGSAKTSEAAGFFITNWARGNDVSGCRVKNAYNRNQAARMGFYFQDYISEISVVRCKTRNLPFINGVDGAENAAYIPIAKNIGVETTLQVGDIFFSTLSKDSKGNGSGASAPTAASVIPSEIGSVMAHWDFSDTAKVTSSGGRVSAVAMESGTATDGTLVQSDAAKQPWISALAGKSAIKVKSVENDFLQAPAIGTAAIGTGWTIAFAGSVNSNVNGQYLVSTIGGGATKPVSITVTEMLGLRANSNGSTNGWTAKSADKALTQYATSVIVMVGTSSGVDLYVNGVKSAEAPIVSVATADLSGKFTLGSYYGSASAGTMTGGADSTIGEVAVFAKALSANEVSGLSGYLLNKWA